jgi:hypothetical protein
MPYRVGICTLRFVTLLLITLVFGLAFAHVMELPGKLRLDGPAWLTVQQNLYVGFGALGSVAEPLAILLTWVLVAMLRGRRPAFWLTLVAAVCVTAGLAEWATIVAPMNARLSAWTQATLPADWTATRDRWELGHVLHAALFGAAFCLLVAAMLADTRRAERAGPDGTAQRGSMT